MKNIVTNTYSFEQVSTGGYVYVDKTALLWRLANASLGNMFFLARPRRFGKSLMLSTLKALFQGRRELFRGLAVAELPFEWKTHPVIHLDLSLVHAPSVSECRRLLCRLVSDAATANGVAIAEDAEPGRMLQSLILALAAHGDRVVVLVDEYDAPLAGALGDRERLEALRTLLHDFYVVLKAMDAHVRFLMMTGVSKFAKLSVFSGLNNLTDISSQAEFATLLGYTEEELRAVFAPHLAAFAAEAGTDVEAIVARLKHWYNGYRFSPRSEARVLNPVSVGRALAERAFQDYWNATGAATLIVERLCRSGRLPCELERLPATREVLESCDPVSLPVATLLYQGGYLTIRAAEDEALVLGVPNQEVRLALTGGHVLAVMGEESGRAYQTASVWAGVALRKGDVRRALETFRAAFAALPYEWLVRDEGAAKVAFLDFFHALPGVTVHAERQTANGRIDAVVELSDAVYVIEFKCDETAEAAFGQIVARDYAAPYRASGKRLVGVGLNCRLKRGADDVRGLDEPVVRDLV